MKLRKRASVLESANGRWYSRTDFAQSRATIVAFFSKKWVREQQYRLIKELWAFESNRIAVRFTYMNGTTITVTGSALTATRIGKATRMA